MRVPTIPTSSISNQPPRVSDPVYDDDFEQARRQMLALISKGSKTSVYAIPESFGRHVLKVGPHPDIRREMEVIQELTRAYCGLRSVSPPVKGGRLGQTAKLPVIPELKGPKAPWSLLQSDKGLDQGGPEMWDMMRSRMPREGIDGDIEDVISEKGEYEESKAPKGQAAIILRRIGGLPDNHRTRVLNQFYQHDSKASVLASPKNDNLLVRIYLGETSPWYPLPEDDGNDELVADEDDLYNEDVSLLNFPGHVDLLYLYFSSDPGYVKILAAQMGFGYAVLHWGARFDGRGIEFLLGLKAGSNIRLHMLGFEECQRFVCWTRKCVVKQLVPAALENGRYLPHPSLTPDLWRAFKKAYIELSRTILKQHAGIDVWKSGYRDGKEAVYKLPELFIEELKKGFNEQHADENATGVWKMKWALLVLLLGIAFQYLAKLKS